MLATPKARNVRSGERSACGVIKTMQTQTPTAQERLKSAELLRFLSFNISGILNKGKAIAATVPVQAMMLSIRPGTPLGTGF